MIPWTEKLDLKGAHDERISLPATGVHAVVPAVALPGPNGLQEASGALLRYWKLIGKVSAGFLVLGATFLVVTRPQYEANALVQVEMSDKSMSKVFSAELSEMTGHQTQVAAEVELLKSRLVLDSVIEKLRLDISASPRYFPVIGSFVASGRGGPEASLWEAPGFLSSYAWGGERAHVASLQIPEGWNDGVLSLRVVDATTYELLAVGAEAPLLSGVVGTSATASTSAGEIEITVDALKGAPGTVFDLSVSSRPDAMANLLSDYRASEQGKESGLIKVSYRGEDPVQVAAVVNFAIDEYRKQDVSWRVTKASDTLAFLTAELPSLRSKMNQAESALTQYKLSNSGPDLTTETTLLLQQSVSLEQNILQLQQQRQDLMQRFTEDHPSVLALTSQIAQASGKRAEIDRKLRKLPDSQRDLATLTRDMDINAQLMTRLLNEMHQLEVAKSGSGGVVRIVDHAAKPTSAAFPKPAIVMTAALMLGLIVGCFVAALMAAMRRRVERASEVSAAASAPCLSVIPASQAQARLERAARKAKTQSVAKPLVLTDPKDVAAEGFRWLRASLLTDASAGLGGTYLFTGLSSDVGRSFVLSNLAAMLARSGLSVVVVDADLRDHSMAGHYAATGAGVAEWLTHAAGVDEIVTTSGPELPDFIGAGLDRGALEKLTTGRLRVLFQQLDERYDFVLVNAPDVASYPDALVVAKAVSGVVLVCRQSAHEPESVRHWTDQLRRIGVPLVGTVLNRARKSDSWGYIGAAS